MNVGTQMQDTLHPISTAQLALKVYAYDFVIGGVLEQEEDNGD